MYKLDRFIGGHGAIQITTVGAGTIGVGMSVGITGAGTIGAGMSVGTTGAFGILFIMIHGFLLIGVVISFTDPIEVEMLPTSTAIEIQEREMLDIHPQV